jgi:hypothetical protein
MIIELQRVNLQENAKDKHRLDFLSFWVAKREWLDIGYNPPMREFLEDGTEKISGSSEYYLNGGNYAPTLREAVDKWLDDQEHKEDIDGEA